MAKKKMVVRGASVNVRVSSEMKKNAQKILNSLGFSLSGAIEIYLQKIIDSQGIPFDIKLPKGLSKKNKSSNK